MEKYYTVYSQPVIPAFFGKWSENQYETQEEAEKEAEAIANANPLVRADVYLVEGICYEIVKTFCNVRFG